MRVSRSGVTIPPRVEGAKAPDGRRAAEKGPAPGSVRGEPTPGIGSGSTSYWPVGLEPSKADIFAQNEIVIPAPPEAVWNVLTNAEEWPKWYSNSFAVKNVGAPGKRLSLGDRFSWWSFGMPVDSKVTVYEPNKAIGWTASLPIGGQAFHLWRLERDGNQTRIISEESQSGVVQRLGRGVGRRLLEWGHQGWLEGLRRRVALVSTPRTGRPG